MAPAFAPQKIFADRSVLSSKLARKILNSCPDVPCEVVPDRRRAGELPHGSSDPISEGKKNLWLTTQKGPFVKPCPCTPHYIGCNYFIINAVLNCPLDCSYCILQLYLSNPLITVYVNLDDLWKELDRFLGRRGRGFVRIGTGELGDSLALNPLTRTAREFIAYFRSKPDVFFELKTKTVHVEDVLECEPAENIVLSWSLNAAEVVRREEQGAPPVEARLEAARRVVDRGFPVGFHFDPLIAHPGWEEGYSAVVEMLLEKIPVSRIRWISLGTLRFSPPLKQIIEKRFPETTILDGELVQGRDGKLRYFKPIRLEMYRKIVRFIQSGGGKKIPLYFCMEDEEVWKEVLTLSPGRKEEVELLLLSRFKGHR